MSHRRTHLWISLIVGVIVWGAYFAHFLTRMQTGTPGVLMLYFLAALAVTVLAELVATGLIAWLFRRRADAGRCAQGQPRGPDDGHLFGACRGRSAGTGGRLRLGA